MTLLPGSIPLQTVIRQIFLITIAILSFSGAFGQRYNIEVFNSSSGLPDNQVTALLQDNYGRLWVGTMKGLCIYDGLTFNLFTKGNPIADNPITSLLQDSKGNIWIGTIRKGVT